jgi:ubiquinol-cytochrome c reductase cytochrome c1 subunit
MAGLLGKFSKPVLGTAGLLGGIYLASLHKNGIVHASGDAIVPQVHDWPHKRGMWAKTDPASQRRGFEVYRQVCSTCHSMNELWYRELIGLIYTEEQAKAVAASVQVTDGPNQEGQMYKRPGRLYDRMPAPYPNEEFAAFINGGAVPPDLSYIVRGRFNGEDYIFSLLTGYKDAPAGVAVRQGLHYNPYFSGGLIAMAPPLNAGGVEWEDDTPQTVSQMAKDVVTFLAWNSDCEGDERHLIGIKFLLALSAAIIGAKWNYRWKWNVLRTRRITFMDFPGINDKYWASGPKGH